jgi:CheY-like chemotaxis protein
LNNTLFVHNDYADGIWAAALDDSEGSRPSDDNYDYGKLLDASFNILAVDDDLLVLRMVSRVLKKYADRIFTAESAVEAERILVVESVQFVVCDYNLGPNVSPGTVVLEQLRRRFSSIEYAVIFTGEEPPIVPSVPAADAVLHKSSDMGLLCEMVERSARAVKR